MRAHRLQKEKVVGPEVTRTCEVKRSCGSGCRSLVMNSLASGEMDFQYLSGRRQKA